jgi:sugar phosphate isomerase/epimerase
MSPQISVQLYSVRDEAEKDYATTIQKISDMGFQNVEPAGYPGFSAQQASDLFRGLKLSAPSCHGPLPLGEDKNKIIEEALMLGHQYIFTGCPTNFKEDFKTIDRIKATAERYCEAAEFAAKHNIQVGYHNHDWDLALIDGVRAYQVFLEHTPDTVLWEADIFWVAKAGLDPAAFIKEIGVRGKCLHFKDGVINEKDQFKEVENESGKVMVSEQSPFLPAGQGDVDLIKAFQAVEHAEYIMVELDSYTGNIMEAIQESYTYLTSQNIAHGTK